MSDQHALVPHRRVLPRVDALVDRAAAAGGKEIPAAELRLLEYLKAVYRRRYLVAAVMMAAVALTAYHILSQPRMYDAKARLLLEAGAPNVVMFAPVLDERPNADYYTTQYEILRSRTLAERTIDEMGGWTHPDIAGRVDPTVWRRVLTRVRSYLGLPPLPEPPAPSAPATRADRAGRVSAFLGRLSINPVKQSRIVEVVFRSSDPKFAAEASNTLSRVYIDHTLETRARPNSDAANSLRHLLEAQRKEMEASEEALQRYRERHDAVPRDGAQDILMQKLAQLSTAATAARTERIEKSTLYSQLRSIQESRASLDTFPAILSNGFIQGLKSELAQLQQKDAQLSEQLGELHPDIVQLRGAMAVAQSKLKAEVDKAAEAVHNEYLAAAAREKALTQALEDQQRDVLARDRNAIEYGSLERAAATNRQIYESLLQRAKETEVASSVNGGYVRVVDQAEVPRWPLPRPIVMYSLLALIWGGTLGVGLVFVLEFFDDRIKSPADVQQHLSLPCFGFAPVVQAPGSARLLGSGSSPSFTEAIRNIGATLLTWPHDLPRSVLVTSATAGEGKTLVAGNLALALSRIGQRVLLVDTDLRRPQVHELFGVNRGPGLSDLLLGSARLGTVLQSSDNRSLWYITAGTPQQDSSDLLGSDRLAEVIGQLTSAFDWVIVDSPPVLAVADTSFVAKSVSSVLLVVGAGTSKRDVVQAAVERLESLHARPIGVVLNRADLRANADDYYPYYHAEKLE